MLSLRIYYLTTEVNCVTADPLLRSRRFLSDVNNRVGVGHLTSVSFLNILF